jgi:II/X family phage/plasmid replication protein
MAYDTIKLKSPYMPESVVRAIEQQCILRSGIDLATGALLYELHSGELLGSWDSRIAVRPMYEDWVIDKNGRPRLAPSEPYITVECSVHKAMLGHNVYGGPTNFRVACSFLVDLLEKLLGVDLPASNIWTVHRVDVAHVFALSRPAIKEFFDSISLRNFPRRQKKAAKYDMAVYFAGKTTTVKFYHKGSEFKVHDYARLRHYFRAVYAYQYGKGDTDNLKRAERKLKALQRLAENRLRVEVEVHSDKFQYDFGKNPLVEEVTDQYLEAVHDKEVERLLREGKQAMETVRTTTAVMTRLQNLYGQTKGQRLYGFWAAMCTLNENVMRDQYTRATFFRNRKLLEEAGVSWRSSDITVTANDSLIHDFTPMRVDRRFCSSPARNRPEFNISREELRLAA